MLSTSKRSSGNFAGGLTSWKHAEDLFEEVMCKLRSAGPKRFASLRGEMTRRRLLFQERHIPRQRHSPRRGKQVQGTKKVPDGWLYRAPGLGELLSSDQTPWDRCITVVETLYAAGFWETYRGI